MSTFYHLDALWNCGFFCSYQAVVGFLDFIEQKQTLGLHIGYKVFFEKGLYFDINIGHNWWEYFFEPIESGDRTKFDWIDHPGNSLKSKWQTDSIATDGISRERAAELIQHYIKIKKPIQDKIDNFVKENYNGHYLIGIHFRGCDKSSEAARVNYDTVATEVRTNLIGKNNPKIFIATDEQQFVDYMVKQFGNLVCYTNAQRAPDDHQPLHHVNGMPNMNRNRYCLGEEAVIDCYLLSKCDLMIRTFSNLSSSAANINPSIPVINLNKDLHCKDRILR